MKEPELFLVTNAKLSRHRRPKLGGGAGVASPIETPERPSDPSIVEHGVEKHQAAGRTEHTPHLSECCLQLAIGQVVGHVDAHDEIERGRSKRHAGGIAKYWCASRAGAAQVRELWPFDIQADVAGVAGEQPPSTTRSAADIQYPVRGMRRGQMAAETTVHLACPCEILDAIVDPAVFGKVMEQSQHSLATAEDQQLLGAVIARSWQRRDPPIPMHLRVGYAS